MSANRKLAPAICTDLDFSAKLERQVRQAQQQAFQMLGVLSKIHVEAGGIADPSAAFGGKRVSAGLEWYGKTGARPVFDRSAGAWKAIPGSKVPAPGIAFGAAGDLLVIGALPHPGWTPDPVNQPAPRYTAGVPDPDRPGQFLRGPELIEQPVNMMLQNPAHVADGAVNFAGADWLLFQPIHGILLHGARGGFLTIGCKSDPQGRSCCLIWDPANMRGHFLYGLYEIAEFGTGGRGGLERQTGALESFLEAEGLREKGQSRAVDALRKPSTFQNLSPSVAAIRDAAHGKPDAGALRLAGKR